jgi:hypothetical protein
MVFGRICLADGGIAFVRTGSIPMVPALAATVHTVGLQAAAHRLDGDYYSAYYVWHLRALGRPWLVPGWIMLLEYGSVAAAGAILALRRIPQSPLPQCSTE